MTLLVQSYTYLTVYFKALRFLTSPLYGAQSCLVGCRSVQRPSERVFRELGAMLNSQLQHHCDVDNNTD